MAEEDIKVHLVLVLKQDTLRHLDMYITMHGSEKMACLKTIQERLFQVLYIQMQEYLK